MRTFRDTIRHEQLAFSAEIPLRPGTGASEIAGAAETLGPAVDAVQLGDNRYSPGHLSPLAAASIVRERGLDAIVHLICRDRNRIALQSDLLGAAALGVTSVILARGDKLSDDAPVKAKGVFDTNATRLVRMAGQLADFYVGSPVTVFDPAEGWEATRIDEKLDAGVAFLQTQPCLNVALLERYIDNLVQRKVLQRASLVVEVPLLTSLAEARLLKNVARGAPIPDAAVQRIAEAADPVREGIAVCSETLVELRELPGISGINIHYQRDPADVVAALRSAGLLRTG